MRIKQTRIYSQFTKRVVICCDIELVDNPSHSIVQCGSRTKNSHTIFASKKKTKKKHHFEFDKPSTVGYAMQIHAKAFKFYRERKKTIYQRETLAERVGDVFITIKFVHFAYLHIDIGARPTKINCNVFFFIVVVGASNGFVLLLFNFHHLLKSEKSANA